MLFTLSGDDAASFKTDNNGQISTKVKLDHETKDTYMVALKATDPSGASDTIMVTVTVTDENDNAVITGSDAIDYNEKGMGPVAAYSATDQDGDDIVWSLDGTDKDDFTIGGGVLAFKSAPNYEDPKSDSIGTRADKNVYNVTVQATGGSRDVVVTVVNVDEDGSVSFTNLGQVQPQVGRSVEATLSDPDEGETDEIWQWARSMDMETWTGIDGATAQKRSPTAADEGYYLRASVTYRDAFGPDKTAYKVTPNKVEERTVANAAPSFADQDDDNGEDVAVEGIQINREVDENTPANTNIGKPVSASDGDNDVLVYTLGGEVTIGGDQVDATTLFSVSSSTGQLKTKAALDFENTAGNPADNNYAVTVTATDPSGASATETVTIELKDVNEAPKFEEGDNVPAVLNVVENTSTLRVGATGDTGLDGTAYNADDEDATQTVADGTDAETEANAALTLSGADAKYFTITPGGELTLVDDDPDTAAEDDQFEPNYESKSSFSITVQAQSGAGVRTLRTRLDVTVHVIDAEDPGTVSLTAREPQAGRTVVATLSDPDGGIILTSWKWERSETPLAEDAANCDSPGTWEEVEPSVSSGAYTPKEADNHRCLRAIATYTDNIEGHGETTDDVDVDTDGLQVAAVSEKPVQLSAADNTAPKFQDQDLTADGDQSDETTREVDENKDGENVGGPITAVDADSDAMIYRLSGDDAASFKTDNNGQITTKVKLDFETKDMYVVALTAEDPSGARDSIQVTIMVLDGPDVAVIVANAAPAFDAETAERSVDEDMPAGTDVGDPVEATDPNGDDVTYTISGSMYFEIDEMSGQITTTAVLDYETMASHEVTVTATDEPGLYAMIAVTIMVNDVDESPCVVGGAVSADAGLGLIMDCETLLDIMDDLIGDGTAELNWSEDTPIGEWDDVAAGTGRVAGLYLPNRGLAGTIPAEITKLDALTNLTLTDNDLTGEIPDLSGLDNLKLLVLGGNAFTGGIPASLGNLESLLRLWLHRNEGGFEGGIPAELGNLSNLRYLMLHGNGLTGEIPSELGNATNLKALYLYDNMLTGSIPASLGNLMTDADDTLRLLYLQNNMLSGDVPAELGNLVSLTKLRLSGNMLTGCIPAAIAGAAVDADRAGLMACTP